MCAGVEPGIATFEDFDVKLTMPEIFADEIRRVVDNVSDNCRPNESGFDDDDDAIHQLKGKEKNGNPLNMSLAILIKNADTISGGRKYCGLVCGHIGFTVLHNKHLSWK